MTYTKFAICTMTELLTAQKMKSFIKDFFSKCNQIRRKLRIWSHLLKKSLMENFIFCAVFWLIFTKNFLALYYQMFIYKKYTVH